MCLSLSQGHCLVCVPNMSHKNVSAWVIVSWTAPRWSHFSTTVQTTIETWLNYGHFWFRSFRLTDYLLGCQFEENRKLVSGNKNSLIFVSLVLRDDCALSSLISEIHEPLDELQAGLKSPAILKSLERSFPDFGFVDPCLILDKYLYHRFLLLPKAFSDLENMNSSKNIADVRETFTGEKRLPQKPARRVSF